MPHAVAELDSPPTVAEIFDVACAISDGDVRIIEKEYQADETCYLKTLEDQRVTLPIWIIVSTIGGFLAGWSLRGHCILHITTRKLK